MQIQLFNTLTREKEGFKSLQPNKVGMYHCGPTVYDYAHIGNFRAYIFADILRRMFEYNGYEVNQVMNLTDVGHLASDADEGIDKMTKALEREGKPITLEAMKEVADFYAAEFFKDLDSVNIKRPQTFPKATEHIKEQIELIKRMEEKGATYTISDGVYFDTSQALNYGELAKLDIDNLKAGARVETNPEKKNPIDFALWKFSGKFNKDMGWDSPWGKGFPGWHLECSAMSMKYLGENFDVHTGGIDLIPIHHTNEIAQSETATGKPFVNYWMHSDFVDVSGEKMAKSAGNFITLKTLTDKEFDPLAYRYLVLTAHYRTKINFTFDSLMAAQNALGKLYTFVSSIDDTSGKINEDYKEKFTEAINDDLDTPKAIALMWELIKNPEISPADKYATLIDFDHVLGLNLATQKTTKEDIPKEVGALAQERQKAREEKDFKKSDELRDKIAEMGYEVKDLDDSFKINKL
ncbi:cysteine--tRNA ligase [Patescibacteria group bacterium]